MKRILATTALVALTSVPVFAQSDAIFDDTADVQVDAFGTLDVAGMPVDAGDMIGKAVYVSDIGAGIIPDNLDAPSDDWEEVGTIDDVILTADGQIDGLVADIGGFFGIGAQPVAIGVSEVTLVADSSSDDGFFVVFNGSAATLEDRDELDRAAMVDEGNRFFLSENTEAGSIGVMDETTFGEGVTDQTVVDDAPMDSAGAEPMLSDEPVGDEFADPMLDDGSAMDDNFATAPMDGTAPVDETMGSDVAMDDTPFLDEAERSALTADDLIGTNVDDMSGERVGSISDIVLTDDGAVSDVIVNVGGFLGIGAKSVAIGFDDIQIVREEGAFSTTLRASTTITAEQFDAMEEWQG
jgi:sporulation protein YlmC with PRC-barrel domain